jgi:hypothetical protein
MDHRRLPESDDPRGETPHARSTLPLLCDAFPLPYSEERAREMTSLSPLYIATIQPETLSIPKTNYSQPSPACLV